MWGRRARRRRARRELQRRLGEIAGLDPPSGVRGVPYPQEPLPRRRIPTLGPGLLALISTLLLVASVISFHPSSEAGAVRALFGFSERPFSFGARGPGRYAFLDTQRGSEEPVRWNPCQPIRIEVNPYGAPERWDELVHTAMAAVTEASGLRFRYLGTTTDRDFADRRQLTGWKPVLVGWATDDEIPELTGDVAGLGGAHAAPEGAGRKVYVTGQVVLDIEAFDRLAHTPYGRSHMQGIVTHEFGHLVGLDHVNDPGELMFSADQGLTEFGRGDRSGLEILGQGPC